MAITSGFWRGRCVLVTGHTGFKGGWLSLWLQALGAEVHGFALEPPTQPNLFSSATVGRDMASSRIGDVRDFDTLSAVVKSVRPEIVFHLAAQALVRHAYRDPVATFAVNIMGAVHLLEAIRATQGVRAVIVVTSDKCYRDSGSFKAHVETDALGGLDPYSSSKGCAELVTAAYRSSFLAANGVAVASARAGNVIGGGDWAEDRLLPDYFRALDSGTALSIRSPGATRPWQHVLDPLAGYLVLAERLDAGGAEYAGAWNFGPADGDARSVAWILEYLSKANPGLHWVPVNSAQPHETAHLRLDSAKAQRHLGWRPRWDLPTALDKTLEWHDAVRAGRDAREVTHMHIAEYSRADADTVRAAASHGAI